MNRLGRVGQRLVTVDAYAVGDPADAGRITRLDGRSDALFALVRVDTARETYPWRVRIKTEYRSPAGAGDRQDLPTVVGRYLRSPRARVLGTDSTAAATTVHV